MTPDTIMPPMTPRAARRWEELYGNDEVTSQKQRAQALYEVGGSKSGGAFSCMGRWCPPGQWVQLLRLHSRHLS